MVCHFYVELIGTNPFVWRRILVPGNYTLYRLHMALQGAFCWENSHLFQFCENELTDRVGYGVPYIQDPDPEIIDARKARIGKVFKKPGQQYCYMNLS